MIRYAALALALAGCSAAGDGGQGIRPPLTLTPDSEIEGATRQAAAAWSAATGIPIVIGAGGVRVRVVDDLDACGRTHTLRRPSGAMVRVDAIEIRRAVGKDCGRWPRTVRHELGHAIQQWGSQDAFLQHDGHAAEGLMALHANSVQVIDGPALELACTGAPCTRFEPEAP